MKKKLKILYLFHNDWNWIKQRSHFFAEGLHSSGALVHVLYKFSFRRKNLVKNISPVSRYALLQIPFAFRTIRILRKVDQIIFSFILMILNLINKYDAVIITHPLLFDYTSMIKTKVFYDCHDDNEEFYDNGSLKNLIVNKHKKSLINSHLNIFSSEHLFLKYSSNKKDLVIRNGHDNLHFKERNPNFKKDIFSIYYFGSVSSWFDLDLVTDVVEKFDSVEFNLIGPVDIKIPNHHRINVLGPKKHNELIEICFDADAFIMPFKINELIKGVDPVKLYEYLSYDASVISVYYDELNYFKPHINFYNSIEDAMDLIEVLLKSPLLNVDQKEKRKLFLKENSWENRHKNILDVLSDA